ncbi:MAG: carbamoyl-phosphate synthase (glutamine-hydrolyzing) [Planctomycetota bacterium]|nr:MAG: carbamoyl-phosphate synthase (glutamine-hydrolyzing) [Planctomycetota bacterium]
MPKRTDIQNILILGSGPIVIGQGCEFDYSGTQACKALREEGYSVVLLNSNPATIMTDPGLADRTYIEPITPEFVEKILIKEREDGRPVHALLPTLGGQTALNVAMECHERGMLERQGVKMIGASPRAIHLAEDRTAFKETMQAIGIDVPKSGVAHTWDEARDIIKRIGLPCCIRPAYTLGGEGGGFARTAEEFEVICRRGLAASRVSEILIEEDLYGWKEFELEVMRDRMDNVVIICSIENFDPMGVHTGDSITVAPIQTLTDKEYQKMRDSAIAIIRAIGVDTGGCNIQFGVDPHTGRQVAIEMNPRVSRSSALASKATGYPIARIAAKLAVGYTLDELPNDITKTTPASFEPVLDYVVVKIPRWSFEKFPDSDETLTTHMKSVGEAMAIGRNFKEAFQKCIRSMEIKRSGYGLDANDAWLKHRRQATGKRQQEKESVSRAATVRERWVESIVAPARNDSFGAIGGTMASEAPSDTQEEHAASWPIPETVLIDKLSRPSQGRPYYIRYAFKMGWSLERVYERTRIDKWFLEQIQELAHFEDDLLGSNPDRSGSASRCDASAILKSRRFGYSGAQLERATGEKGFFRQGSSPVYKLVDTCAAEFEAVTPYYYSSHESPVLRANGESGTANNESEPAPTEPSFAGCSWPSAMQDEVRLTDQPKIVVLGGGPNRIGQGIEFDYCCCHASFAARKAGYESVMINSNPETVSTDFDTSDLLFFEPLTQEDVLNVISRLNPQDRSSIELRGANYEKGKISHTAPAVTRPSSSALPRVAGVICQFGGQTPLNLAQGLKEAGVPIIGTQPEMIHLAEDREEFARVLRDLSLLQPPNGIARGRAEALRVARQIGYPVLVRPSYVLGGRGMRVCNNDADLNAYIDEALAATDRTEVERDNPILIDKFLVDAIEVDVDAVADFGRVCARGVLPPTGDEMCIVAGIMEHIEEAGIHSGDSTCVLPPFSLGRMVVEEIFRSTRKLAKRLQVCGAMNVQYAVLNRTVYVLEVNPRASRTLPFVAKATGVPWAEVATRVMLGEKLRDVLDEHGVKETPMPKHVSVKAPVFPFSKLHGVDVVLGPEMRSTGEVMAIASNFGRAFAKAQIATGMSLPTGGNVLISVKDEDKPRIVSVARDLRDMGFCIYSTTGTRKVLEAAGIPSLLVSKHSESGAPFLKDLIDDGTLHLLINTPIHTGPASAEGRWRAAAFARRVPIITTLAGAVAAVQALRAITKSENGDIATPLSVRPLQSYHAPPVAAG